MEKHTVNDHYLQFFLFNMHINYENEACYIPHFQGEGSEVGIGFNDFDLDHLLECQLRMCGMFV